ncbi:hypothetical protein [Listeria cornellensis]|uniref:Phytoene dehydrogenase n=1 Tax=Listeria cornellensis FSL F6-0969 TaxID=1265820 RepID=W7C4B9_9LIST|nr:hypothetical protein [Listeria cornellensis]EUJ31947.1 phytoene dehydrogenase [Listeria cornellensis FSL F6-0969]
MDKIMRQRIIPEDLSIHITYPTAVDKTMAPKDMSTLRILVPVPNNNSTIDWKKESSAMRQLVLKNY